MAFARKIVSMCDEIKRSSRGCPPLPPLVPDALETFKSMEYGQDAELWQFVNLADVFQYIRGGKQLKIPAKWAAYIPKAYPSIP